MFHVFNINDGKGFVIASADDVAVPVLGYSENGAFDINNIPINMKEWLEGYGEEIRKARENGVVPKGNAPVHASRQKINPMIKSTWDQGAPYNNMCYFNRLPCLTGCVATAMAQIMYYWATTGIDGKNIGVAPPSFQNTPL
ncbi:MAG: Spi family protease inhibitor [Prevotella sp.]|nr:Spi family protease inhibitor [Prevotella sp.]